MGKKRKRAVAGSLDQIEIDPLYFDNPVDKEETIFDGIKSIESNELITTRNLPLKYEKQGHKNEPTNLPSSTTLDIPEDLKDSKSQANTQVNSKEVTVTLLTDEMDNNIASSNNKQMHPEDSYTDEEFTDEEFMENISRTRIKASIADTGNSNVSGTSRISSESQEEDEDQDDGVKAEEVILISDSEEEEVVEISSTTCVKDVSSKSAAAKPQARTVEITIICKIPNQQSKRKQSWDSTTPFYSLEQEFGRDSVFVYNNTSFKKYITPARLNPDASHLEVLVVTEKQWREFELGLVDRIKDNNEETESVKENEDKESRSDRFPITLESKHGQVRVLVTPESVIQDLVNHFLKTKGLAPGSSVTVKFDGDTVDLKSTLIQLEVEEDDKLDIYWRE